LLALGLLTALFVARLPSLEQPLVEAYGFRLTFTAWTARLFHQEGIELLHPKVPVLGSPWQVPMEFPLYQALAALLMDSGLEEALALRGLSLAFFTLTGWLLYRLVLRLVDGTAALAALVAFGFSPMAFLWSRAALIESLATAATLAWALAAWSGAGGQGWRRRAWLATAVVAGSIAMLVKPTTAAWWCLPVLLGMGFTPAAIARGLSKSRQVPRLPWTAAAMVTLVPLLSAAAWTRHADSVKGAGAGTRFLTSGNAAEWNFGPLSQRADADAWAQAVGHVVQPVTGAAGLAALVILMARHRQVPLGLWAVLATVPLTVLTFWNLYVVHGYYWMAVAPAIAAGIGTGAVIGIRALPDTWQPVVTVLAALVWLGSTLAPGWTYVALAYKTFPADHEAMGVGTRLAKISDPDEQAFVTGLGYDPSILYFANRRGFMIRDGTSIGAAASQVDLQNYRFAVVLKPREQSLASTFVRGWAAPRDPLIYELAPDAAALEPAPVRFTREVASQSERPPAQRLTCSELDHVIRAATGRVWVKVQAAESARVTFAETLAPVPGDARTLVIDHELLPPGWQVQCQGDVAISLIGAAI
jgi:hypothetical protein